MGNDDEFTKNNGSQTNLQQRHMEARKEEDKEIAANITIIVIALSLTAAAAFVML